MANILDRNFDFLTNGTVTAAGLHNLIDETNIYAGLISTQEEKTTVGTSDLLLVADSSSIGSPQIAANRTTVYNLFDDALTGGTYANAQLSGNLTYGTATGNRTISTGANITNGTISTLIAGTTTSTAAAITNGTITTALIPTLTAGTTTGTAGIFTSGTVATLNSTTGTIGNLSTTLAGDFTISRGTGTLGTTGATLGTYGGSTSVPVLAINAKGQVTSTGTAAITSGLTGFRNRIINGDMRIDQRNAGASQTFTAAAALAYSVDRFYGYCTGANVTGQRVAGTSPNEFVYRFTGAASVTAIGFGTRLEATNTTDLAGSTATLSVQLANSLLTSVTWTAYYASTKDQFGTLASPTRTQIATGTFTVTSTLTTYNTQISIPSAATTGIEIVFTVGAQTSGTWTIDNVQLEAGSTATEFERRPIGTELALCQRYYSKSYEDGTAPGSATTLGLVFAGKLSTNSYGYCSVNYDVKMRAAPTINYWDGNGNASKFSYLPENSASSTFTHNIDAGLAPFNISSRSFCVSASFDVVNSSFLHFQASAEL